MESAACPAPSAVSCVCSPGPDPSFSGRWILEAQRRGKKEERNWCVGSLRSPVRRGVASYLCKRPHSRRAAAAETGEEMLLQRLIVLQTSLGGDPLLATSPSLQASLDWGPSILCCAGVLAVSQCPRSPLAELRHQSDHLRAPPTFKSGAHVG